MALPRILKDVMIYNNGERYLGQAASVTVPKLARKLEGWRGAGMDREIKVDMGGEALEAEFTCGGPMRDVIRQYGAPTIDGLALRFVGAFQNDETGREDSIEMIVRGRHEEIDAGEWKPGEKSDFKVKMALAYLRIEWNGRVDVEIDVMNMVEIVGGIDRLADRRAALGI